MQVQVHPAQMGRIWKGTASALRRAEFPALSASPKIHITAIYLIETITYLLDLEDEGRLYTHIHVQM